MCSLADEALASVGPAVGWDIAARTAAAMMDQPIRCDQDQVKGGIRAPVQLEVIWSLDWRADSTG